MIKVRKSKTLSKPLMEALQQPKCCRVSVKPLPKEGTFVRVRVGNRFMPCVALATAATAANAAAYSEHRVMYVRPIDIQPEELFTIFSILKYAVMSLKPIDSLEDHSPGGERRQVAAAALVQCSHVESHEPLARAN